ncbi:hypothetical protein [Caldimonas tepidiphila]|uniref:hypothetical protein n=1 Tax=Caldimonas tepidiphila TaxID=2315841 RepID=UPI0014752D17|nr:hypothetical protein [Caldimonas tepidiphila]
MREDRKKPYQVLLDKMKSAYAAEHYHEVTWLAYRVLEDRLGSVLRQSGGATFGNHRPIQTLGPQIGELSSRRERDPLLGEAFSAELMRQLHDWKEQRDTFAQAVAAGAPPFEQIGQDAFQLAQRGLALANLACAATRQFKRQRALRAAA